MGAAFFVGSILLLRLDDVRKEFPGIRSNLRITAGCLFGELTPADIADYRRGDEGDRICRPRASNADFQFLLPGSIQYLYQEAFFSCSGDG